MHQQPVAELDIQRVMLQAQGAADGPLVIIFAGVHGNEHGGLWAMQSLHEDFLQQSLALQKGRVLGLAGNMLALKRRKRFMQADLNRIWVKGHVDKLREEGKAAFRVQEDEEVLELIKVVDRFRAEHDHQQPCIFLDLHSFSAPGGLFSMTLPGDQHADLAKVLGAPTIYGIIEHLNGTALNYFDRQGFISLGFEGGQHDDPNTAQTMQSAILLLLQHLNMLEDGHQQFTDSAKKHLGLLTEDLPGAVQLMYRHAVYPDSGFTMQPGFKNFDPVHAGQVLANDRYGTVKAPCDGYMLMPLYQSQGEDGFFIVADR